MRKGFTIIEVLISVVIVASIFAGVLVSLRFADNCCRNIMYKVGAMCKAQEKIEEIKDVIGSSLVNIQGYDGQQDNVIICTGKTNSQNDDVTAVRSVNIIWRNLDGEEVQAPEDASFAEVSVIVVWSVLNRPYEENISIVTNMAGHG